MAFITRRITGKPGKFHLSLKVWKDPKSWLFSAFVPGILIVPGTVLYFLVFPNEYSGVFRYGMLLGTNAEIVIKSPLLIALVCIIAAAIMIPIQLLELGEEIGWRGYLLGFQIEKYGKQKAVLINGAEWGLAHLPLIYFGFNYSMNNPGAPYTNMALMMVVCVIIGIIFSYITIKTGNCMYAAIIHGVVNVIGELPVYMTHDMESGLLGPNFAGTKLSQPTAERRFKSILMHQGIIKGNEDVHKRGPCLHCLRHCFMLSAFKQLEDSGYAVDLATPYLSIYCGHESLLESEKYMKFSSEMFDEEMEAFSKFSGQLFPEVGL